MAEFTEFQDQEPVSRLPMVETDDVSHEEFANTLRSLSKTVTKTAVGIEKDASASMYAQSVTSINQAKTDTQMLMLENPDQANALALNFKKTVDGIQQNSVVNRSDRNNLKQYGDNQLDSVSLDAARTDLKQARIQTASKLYESWNDQLNTLYKTSLANPDQSEKLKESMLASINGAMSIGSITPEQGEKLIKSMGYMTDRASEVHSLATNQDATARDYHTSISMTGEPHTTSNVDSPVDEGTNYLSDHYNNDQSFQGQLASIQQGNSPDWSVMSKLTNSQFNHLAMAIDGVRDAQGLINSNSSFIQIQSELKSLNDEGKNLDYAQQAKRNYLNDYIKNLQDGNMNEELGKTPKGGQFMQEYINNSSSINAQRNQALMGISDTNTRDQINAQYDNKQFQAKNDMVSKMASLAVAQHIPHGYIQPIPIQDIQNAQSGFSLGSDPQATLDTLNQYNRQNQAYVANGLKMPRQQIITNAISMAGNDVTESEKYGMIAANQEGQTYQNLDLKENKLNENVLKNQAAGLLKEQLNFSTKTYSPELAATVQGEMLNSVVNYAKYKATQNNDLTMNHWKDYIAEGAKLYEKSNPIVSGTNYIINPKHFVMPLSNDQIDKIAQYVQEKGYKYGGQGLDNYSFDLARSRNPLTVTSTPDGHVIAQDSQGKVYFNEPLTASMLVKAVNQVDEENKILNSHPELSINKQIEGLERPVKQRGLM